MIRFYYHPTPNPAKVASKSGAYSPGFNRCLLNSPTRDPASRLDQEPVADDRRCWRTTLAPS